jgi:thiamine-phosphate pyrophosphorylase
MRGLYAIVDTEALARAGIAVLPFAEAVLAARPAALQLRDKPGASGETLALLRAIAPLARRAAVPFFANDRPDLARLAGCDGVHVGQEDVPLDVVRQVAPALAVGISTHRDGEVERAMAARPDYVAMGPVFPTGSKARPSPVIGLAGLARMRRLAATAAAAVPTVAIGGITLESASSVAGLCDAGAVIGALLPDADLIRSGSAAAALDQVRDRAVALHRALGGTAT